MSFTNLCYLCGYRLLSILCSAGYVSHCELLIILLSRSVYSRGGFKEWPLVHWPTRPLPYGHRRSLMKINKKIFNLHYSCQNRIFTPADSLRQIKSIQLGLSTTTMICLFQARSSTHWNDWMFGWPQKKTKKRTHSATLTKKRIHLWLVKDDVI